ncbi:thiamine pyrophosphate-dependent enzyme [Limibacillus sp. MBR-115]|jgi:thiamine pyrophosphate-dependent acetolactate synthase large subunit-like protein|uniref:thiamine pyrophosphate-dependent enzyme n=1 Tax=Limibacillus sp. MBR-115 TaxID=3156465 RepID=UPI00339703AE
MSDDMIYTVDRREAVARILENRPADLAVVTGLGTPTYDVAAAGDHPLNFYLWGAMGSAVMIGLGLALAQPKRRILVVTGDGEMLMGLGSLASAAVKGPENLGVLVLDNERYGETGGQISHSGNTVKIADVAKSCGFPAAGTYSQPDELSDLRKKLLLEKGPVMAVLKVAAGEQARVLPERDGATLRLRFRAAVMAA